MTRLATFNKRRRRRSQSEAWEREWLRTGVLLEIGTDRWGDRYDQFGRLWVDPRRGEEAIDAKAARTGVSADAYMREVIEEMARGLGTTYEAVVAGLPSPPAPRS